VAELDHLGSIAHSTVGIFPTAPYNV
jgi:hypothetical protein